MMFCCPKLAISTSNDWLVCEPKLTDTVSATDVFALFHHSSFTLPVRVFDYRYSHLLIEQLALESPTLA